MALMSTCPDGLPSTSKILRSKISSLVNTPTSSHVGTFPNERLFCGKVWKTLPDGTRESLGFIQTKEAENRIRETAKLLDERVLIKMSDNDSIAKEVKVPPVM